MSDFALRFKDSDKINCFIQFLNGAKSNPYIKYDSSQRNSLFIKARKLNYDISKIKEQCYTDDTALLCLAFMYCGINEKEFFYSGVCCNNNNLIQTLIDTEQFNIVYGDYILGDIYQDKKGNIKIYLQ